MSQDKSHDTTKIRLFLIKYINVHHCLREIDCIKKSSMITKLTEMSFASFRHLGYPKSDPITISINRRACDLMTCNSICFIANTEIQALYPITNTNTFKTSPNIIWTSMIILSTMTPNLSVLHCKLLSPFSEFDHNQPMICTWIRLIFKVKVFKNIIAIHNSCSCAPTIKCLTCIHWMTINIPRSS